MFQHVTIGEEKSYFPLQIRQRRFDSDPSLHKKNKYNHLRRWRMSGGLPPQRRIVSRPSTTCGSLFTVKVNRMQYES